jgi:hypothetical protein
MPNHKKGRPQRRIEQESWEKLRLAGSPEEDAMNNARLLLVASAMFLGSGLGRAAEPFVLAEPPKPATPVETANAGSAPCDTPGAACGHGRTCCEKFRAWLFYQPLSRPGPCGCCLPKAPCCAPELYTFFPCHPGAAPIHDYQADCRQGTSCNHCGWHRKTCACEDQPKPPATGNSEPLTPHDQSKTAAPGGDAVLTWEEPASEPPATGAGVMKRQGPARK